MVISVNISDVTVGQRHLEAVLDNARPPIDIGWSCNGQAARLARLGCLAEDASWKQGQAKNKMQTLSHGQESLEHSDDRAGADEPNAG